MTLHYAELTLDADVDGDDSLETGIFEFEGNLEITTGIETQDAVGGRGSRINSVLSELAGPGVSKRKGISIDLGGGVRYAQVDFQGWTGSSGQWGDDGTDNGVSQTDATGADAISQMDVLMEYLAIGEFDSRRPATLAYGEHSSSGVYAPLDVAVEQPSLTWAPGQQSPEIVDGSIRFLSVVDLRNALDGEVRSVQ